MYLKTNRGHTIKLILFILFMDLKQFYKLSNIFSSRVLTFSFLVITEDNHMFHLCKETKPFLLLLEEVIKRTGPPVDPLTLELDQDDWRLLTSSSMLGMYVLLTLPTAEANFKDVALSE